MNIYELYKEQAVIRRIDDMVEFAVNHRGWPRDKAMLLAVDIVNSGKTIKEFVADIRKELTNA